MTKYPLDPQARVILLEVRVIGPKKCIPLKMVLDTGASITTMPIEVAIAIGCDPTKTKRRIEMITASGTEYAPLITIPKIELFGFTLRNIDVVCHNLPPQSTASGLLGLNILKKFDILLKFRSKILEVTK